MIRIPNIAGIVSVVRTFASANRPELMFGAAVVSTIASIGAAAAGGYKARGIVVEAENPSVNLAEPERPLDSKEKAILTWQCYVPAAVAGVGALGSTTALHLVHIQEKKALAAAALAAVDEAKRELKVYQTVQDRPGPDGVAYVLDSDGEISEVYLVRDERSGRDIWSNKVRIDDAVNELNNLVNGQGNASLNDFYEYAGYSRLPDGDDVGWQQCFVELVWSTDVRDDGRPIRTFRFRATPSEGYDSNP